MKHQATELEENIPVNDHPAVQQTKGTFDTARKQHQTIKSRVDKLDRLCAPVIASSDNHTAPPDRLTALRAQGVLPGLRLELWEKEAELDRARAAYLQAVAEATKALEEARRKPRKAMIAELFTVLYQAQQLAHDIQEYDMQTLLLGGKPPLPPVAELLHDQYRQSFVQANEAVLRKEGWL